MKNTATSASKLDQIRALRDRQVEKREAKLKAQQAAEKKPK